MTADNSHTRSVVDVTRWFSYGTQPNQREVCTIMRIVRDPLTVNKRQGMNCLLAAMKWFQKWDIVDNYPDGWEIVKDSCDGQLSIHFQRCIDAKLTLQEFWRSVAPSQQINSCFVLLFLAFF